MSIKISELPEASTITSSDLLAIVQEGSTKKLPYSVISNLIGKPITEIKQNFSTVAYFDDNFKPRKCSIETNRRNIFY